MHFPFYFITSISNTNVISVAAFIYLIELQWVIFISAIDLYFA